LAHQYSEIELRDSLSDARHILVFWAHAERQIAAGVLHGGLRAHVAAYPDLIVIAATLLNARSQIEHPSTQPEPVWPKLLCNRINERTGASHSDLTPVEQWVQHQRLIARAS
jgi:hypothetical protein